MLRTPTFLTSPTLAPVLNRAILSVTGSHTSQYLNGLLATSVPDSPKRPFYSAFLTPQGRVLCDVFVYTNEDALTGKTGYLIEYDSSFAKPQASGEPVGMPSLLTLLKQHVLRSKVKVRDVTAEYEVYATWGSELDRAFEHPRTWHSAKSQVFEPVWPQDVWPWGTQHHVILDRRAPGMGRRMLCKNGQSFTSNDHQLRESSAYLSHRITHGVPEGVSDMPPQLSFPMDCNLDLMGGLDFRKGCYVGQELTVRTYHTGVVRKRILPVVLAKSRSLEDYASGNTDIRATIKQEEQAAKQIPRPRGSGKLLCSSETNALALLRLEHVAAVDRGDVQLTLGDDPSSQAVSPWWPQWWPLRPWGGSP